MHWCMAEKNRLELSRLALLLQKKMQQKRKCHVSITTQWVFCLKKSSIFYYPPEAHSGRLIFYRIYRHKYEKVTIFVAKHQITIVVQKDDKKVTIFAPKTGEKM